MEDMETIDGKNPIWEARNDLKMKEEVRKVIVPLNFTKVSKIRTKSVILSVLIVLRLLYYAVIYVIVTLSKAPLNLFLELLRLKM